ncbi:unnamed protein product [Rhizophagus irregularis]|nr:hypothetical protein GLOIN_2v1658428 [Rhizophagus irregularis DAOM 181602=DAOM 197198]CAB5362226.1 unnamed protein product [Rhizophagus irregularis]
MLKGVRDESKWMLFIVYFGNIFQVILLYFTTIDFCYKTSKPYSLKYCFTYGAIFNIYLWTTILSWIILILSTLNTIRCHSNFGKNLGVYLRHEPTPDVFKSKLERRESLTPIDLNL